MLTTIIRERLCSTFGKRSYHWHATLRWFVNKTNWLDNHVSPFHDTSLSLVIFIPIMCLLFEYQRSLEFRPIMCFHFEIFTDHWICLDQPCVPFHETIVSLVICISIMRLLVKYQRSLDIFRPIICFLFELPAYHWIIWYF